MMKISKREWKKRHVLGVKRSLRTKIYNLLQGKESSVMTDYELLCLRGFGIKALELVREDEKLRKAVNLLDFK